MVMSSPSSSDSTFEWLIEQLEIDPEFDVREFLQNHRTNATEIIARLDKLKMLGPYPEQLATDSMDLLSDFLAVQTKFSDSSGKRYEVREKIASGGMGEVYQAWDRDLDRMVAIKVISDHKSGKGSPGSFSQRLKRFWNEARVTGFLEHPNIVPIHDLGVFKDGEFYFAMKLVDGITWKEHLRQPLFSSSERRMRDGIAVLLKICDALAFAHRRGIVHRDLKPENIMIGRFGEVQVMDWGLAKVLKTSPLYAKDESITKADSEDTHQAVIPNVKTAAGVVFGTPAFMSPEQADGDVAAIDPRTDIFAMGALLYYLLYGKAPYNGGDTHEVIELARKVEITPPAISAPRELVSIWQRAMSKEPSQRYTDASAFAEDLRAYLEDRPGSAWKENPRSRLRKYVRRKPTQVIGIAAALVLSLATWATINAVSAASAHKNLNSTLVADAERRDKYFAFAFAHANRVNNDVPHGESSAQVNAMLNNMVSDIRSLGIPLQPYATSEQVLEALSKVRNYDPRVGEAAKSLLLSLHHLMSLRQLRCAWEWKHDELPEYMSDAARKSFQKAYEQDTQLVELWPLLAKLETKLQFGEWEELFRTQSESWHRHRKIDLHVLQSSLYFPNNDDYALFRLALLCNKIWQRSTNKPEQSQQLTQTAFELADFAFRRAAEINADNYWLHESAVGFFWSSPQKDHQSQLVWHAELAATLKPSSAVAMERLAGVLLKTNQNPHRAVKLIQRALELDATIPDAYPNLAIALERLKNSKVTADAIPLLQNGITRFPTNRKLHRSLGRLFLTLKRFEEAKATFEATLQIDQPHDVKYYDTWNELGSALENLGRYSEALDSYLEALEGFQPEYLVKNCLWLHIQLGQVDQAEALARRLYIEELNSYIFNLLGTGLLRNGKPEHAATIFAEALSLTPDDLEIPWLYAEALYRTGEFEESLAIYEQALTDRIVAWGGRRQPEEWQEFLRMLYRGRKPLKSEKEILPASLKEFLGRLEAEILAAEEKLNG